MPLPLVPLLVGGLLTAAVVSRKNSAKGKMTPERTIVYETALSKLKDPDKLRQLADTFEGEDLRPQAEVLRLRANLRELPQEVKQARREVIKKALQCKDPEKVRAIALAFRMQGAVGTADKLDAYANGLDHLPS